MSRSLRSFLVFSVTTLIVSIAYYYYVLSVHPPSPERETFLSEVGEGVGEVALWLFCFIYARTLIKLVFGKGPMSRRLLPNYSPPAPGATLSRLIMYLDRSHVYVGIAAVAMALIHIALMGLHKEILFFPIVLALVVWQAVFGMFLSWRGAPRDLKKLSYAVHAQLMTGVAIGVFAYFGHMLIDD